MCAILLLTEITLHEFEEYECEIYFDTQVIECNTLTEGWVLIIDIVVLKKKRENVCNTTFDRSNTTWIWRVWVWNIFWNSGYVVQYSTRGQSVEPWHRNIEERTWNFRTKLRRTRSILHQNWEDESEINVDTTK